MIPNTYPSSQYSKEKFLFDNENTYLDQVFNQTLKGAPSPDYYVDFEKKYNYTRDEYIKYKNLLSKAIDQYVDNSGGIKAISDRVHDDEYFYKTITHNLINSYIRKRIEASFYDNARYYILKDQVDTTNDLTMKSLKRLEPIIGNPATITFETKEGGYVNYNHVITGIRDPFYTKVIGILFNHRKYVNLVGIIDRFTTYESPIARYIDQFIKQNTKAWHESFFNAFKYGMDVENIISLLDLFMSNYFMSLNNDDKLLILNNMKSDTPITIEVEKSINPFQDDENRKLKKTSEKVFRYNPIKTLNTNYGVLNDNLKNTIENKISEDDNEEYKTIDIVDTETRYDILEQPGIDVSIPLISANISSQDVNLNLAYSQLKLALGQVGFNPSSYITLLQTSVILQLDPITHPFITKINSYNELKSLIRDIRFYTNSKKEDIIVKNLPAKTENISQLTLGGSTDTSRYIGSYMKTAVGAKYMSEYLQKNVSELKNRADRISTVVGSSFNRFAEMNQGKNSLNQLIDNGNENWSNIYNDKKMVLLNFAGSLLRDDGLMFVYQDTINRKKHIQACSINGSVCQLVSLANTLTLYFPDYFDCIINPYPIVNYTTKRNKNNNAQTQLLNCYYFTPCALFEFMTPSKEMAYQSIADEMSLFKNKQNATLLYTKYIEPMIDFINDVKDTPECGFLSVEGLACRDIYDNALQRYNIYLSNVVNIESKLLSQNLTVEQWLVFLNDPAFTPIWYYKNNEGKTIIHRMLSKYNFDHNDFLNDIGQKVFGGKWILRRFSESSSRYNDVPTSLKLFYFGITALTESKSIDMVLEIQHPQVNREALVSIILGLVNNQGSSGELTVILDLSLKLWVSPLNVYSHNYFTNNFSYVNNARSFNTLIKSLEPHYPFGKDKENIVKNYVCVDRIDDMSCHLFNDEVNFVGSKIIVYPFSSTNANVMIIDRLATKLATVSDSKKLDYTTITYCNDTYNVLSPICMGALTFMPNKISISSTYTNEFIKLQFNKKEGLVYYDLVNQPMNPQGSHLIRLSRFPSTISNSVRKLERMLDRETGLKNLSNFIKEMEKKGVVMITLKSIGLKLRDNNELIMQTRESMDQCSSKQELMELQTRLQLLENTNLTLQNQISALKKENMFLRNMLGEALKNSFDLIQQQTKEQFDNVRENVIICRNLLATAYNSDLTNPSAVFANSMLTMDKVKELSNNIKKDLLSIDQNQLTLELFNNQPNISDKIGGKTNYIDNIMSNNSKKADNVIDLYSDVLEYTLNIKKKVENDTGVQTLIKVKKDTMLDEDVTEPSLEKNIEDTAMTSIDINNILQTIVNRSRSKKSAYKNIYNENMEILNNITLKAKKEFTRAINENIGKASEVITTLKVQGKEVNQEELNKIIEDLHRNLEIEKQKAINLEAQLRNSKEEVEKMRKELTQATDAKKLAEEEVLKWKRDNSDLRKEILSTNAELEWVKLSYENLEGSIKLKDAEIQNINKKHVENLSRLKEESSKLSEQIQQLKSLESDLKSTKEQNQEFLNKLANFKEKSSTILEDFFKAYTEGYTVYYDNKEYKLRYNDTNLKSKFETFKDFYTVILRKDDLKYKNTEDGMTFKELISQIDDEKRMLKSEKDRLKDQLDKATKMNKTYSEDIENILARLDSTTVSALSAVVQSSAISFVSNKNVESSIKVLTVSRDKLEETESKLESLEADNNTLNTTITNLKRQEDKLTENIALLTRENDNIQRQLNDNTEKYSKIEDNYIKSMERAQQLDDILKIYEELDNYMSGDKLKYNPSIDINTRANNAKNLIKNIQEKVQEKTAIIAKLNLNLESVREQLSEQSRKLEILTKEKKSLADEINDLRIEIREAGKKYNATKTELTLLTQTSEAKSFDLEKQIKDKEKELQSNRDKLKSLTDQLNNSKRENETLRQRINTLDIEKLSLGNDLEIINDNLKKQKIQLERLGDENSRAVSTLESKIKEFQETIDTLKEERDGLKTKINLLINQGQTSNNSIENLNMEVQAKNRNIDKLVEELELLKSKYDSLNIDYQSLIYEKEKLKKERDDIIQKLKDQIELYNTTNQELVTIKKKEAELKKLLKTAENDRQTNNESFEELKIEIEKLREDKKKLLEDLKDYKVGKDNLILRIKELEALIKNYSQENKKYVEENQALKNTVFKFETRIRELENNNVLIGSDKQSLILKLKKLERDVENKDKAIDALRVKVARLEDEYNSNKKELDKSSKALKEIMNQRNNDMMTITNYKRTIEKLENLTRKQAIEIESLTLEKKNLENQIKNYLGKIRNLEEDNDNKTNIINILEKSKKELQEKYDQILTEYDSKSGIMVDDMISKKEFDESKMIYEASLLKFKTEIANYKITTDANKKIIESLRKELEDKGKIEVSQQEFNILKNEKKRLEQHVKELKRKLESTNINNTKIANNTNNTKKIVKNPLPNQDPKTTLKTIAGTTAGEFINNAAKIIDVDAVNVVKNSTLSIDSGKLTININGSTETVLDQTSYITCPYNGKFLMNLKELYGYGRRYAKKHYCCSSCKSKKLIQNCCSK